MTPEGKVKAKLKTMLDKLGIYYFMPATGGYGRSGVPDIVGCFDGMFFGLECKAGKNKPTPLQERNLEEIGNAGGIQMVVNEDNARDVDKLIREKTNGT